LKGDNVFYQRRWFSYSSIFLLFINYNVWCSTKVKNIELVENSANTGNIYASINHFEKLISNDRPSMLKLIIGATTFPVKIYPFDNHNSKILDAEHIENFAVCIKSRSTSAYGGLLSLLVNISNATNVDNLYGLLNLNLGITRVNGYFSYLKRVNSIPTEIESNALISGTSIYLSMGMVKYFNFKWFTTTMQISPVVSTSFLGNSYLDEKADKVYSQTLRDTNIGLETKFGIEYLIPVNKSLGFSVDFRLFPTNNSWESFSTDKNTNQQSNDEMIGGKYINGPQIRLSGIGFSLYLCFSI